MFTKLRQKWKVSGTRLALILCTFAIGGSLTGYVARKLMPFLSIDQKGLWVLVYILLVTLIWPLAVLFISIPFGQFRFFSAYLQKIGRRMGLGKGPGSAATPLSPAKPRQIAIFASGSGTNAEKIIHHFNINPQKPAKKIALIVSNNPGAGIVEIARRHQIPVLLLEKERFQQGDAYLPELKSAGIDFIVLAGFLWKVPASLIQAYPKAIVNIHPALLPNYGGKGMYGKHVHAAVLANQDKVSGITIHYADELYDHGTIISQSTCEVLPGDTVESLSKRVQELEHKHYAAVIDSLL